MKNTTVERYLDAIGQWFVWLNESDVDTTEAKARDLEDWNKSLYLTHTQASKTRNGKMTAVRQFYEWTERQAICPSHMRSVKSAKVDKKLARKYSDSQLKAIFGSCDRTRPIGKRDYAILLLFYATGARRKEIASLSMEDLTVQQRVARVRLDGKGGKERVVSFKGAAVHALVEWLLEREQCTVLEEHAVFVGLTGRNKGNQLGPDGLDDVIYRAVYNSRIKTEKGMALHTLRVTYATDMYDRGVDIETLRWLMGHNDIETTRGYIAISEKRQRTTMPADRLDELTGGRGNGKPLWFEQQQRGLFPNIK
ncbi:MAG: tyrosine-type recombinase/integrase [Gammaproteobacteria bacterium]|nr:tyrosine-type recombinase/integrase [Gammaproteobacteria bacterium]